MPAWLISLRDGASITVEHGLTTIGRHPSCQVRLDSSKVSRRHCCLALDANRLLVRDLGSSNGTWINGLRVESGDLRDGDILMIGQARYRLQMGPPTDGGPPGIHTSSQACIHEDSPGPTLTWEEREIPRNGDTPTDRGA